MESNKQSAQNKIFNTQELKQSGNDMLNMISDLYENIENVPVQPKVDPGFLRAQFNASPPEKGEDINSILKETREKIFPGMTQWQHPAFFAYYPSCPSHIAVLADMFSSTFNSPGFMFNASPSHTEIENITVDWLAQLLGLPDTFQLNSTGGGSFQTSISDALFNTVHAAKKKKMKELDITNTDPRILKFVGYYTSHSFQACEKSLMLKDIGHARIIPVHFDDKVQNFQPDLDKFKEMLEEDVKNGLIPFWVTASLGTTPTCAMDPIEKINEIAEQYKMWVNIDAAYAGASWLCEEFRYQQKGLDRVDSVLINCAKFLLIGMNGAIIYVKDKKEYQKAFSMETMAVVQNPYSSREDCVDYSNWMVGFGRRFNSLKLFYVMKFFGKEGLQEHIRVKVELAKYFRGLIEQSKDFEILTEQGVTLNCFRYIGGLDKQKDLEQINQQQADLKTALDSNSDKGFLVTSSVDGISFIRLVVCNPNTTKEHLDAYWQYIQDTAEKLKK